MTLSPLNVRGRVRCDARRTGVLATVAFLAILVGGEAWAKWWPYGQKVVRVAHSRVYPGHSILDAAGRAGATPSLAHAWAFTVAYGESVWVALVAALCIGAGVQSLVPSGALKRWFGAEGLRGSLRGALASLPCLMCTCCGAPVTNSLRRSGASRASALAYWLGNPLLNPAVLAFLALVLPWQFMVTRLVVGIGLALLAPALPHSRGDRKLLHAR